MVQILEKCIPDGETLIAGIHDVTLQVNKKKISRLEVYIGITEDYLIVSECEERKYLNEFYHIPNMRKTVSENIGPCFPLTEIRSCVIKMLLWELSSA